MNRQVRRRTEMAVSVRDFSRAHPSADASYRVGARADWRQAIIRMEELAKQQKGGFCRSTPSTVRRQDAPAPAAERAAPAPGDGRGGRLGRSTGGGRDVPAAGANATHTALPDQSRQDAGAGRGPEGAAGEARARRPSCWTSWTPRWRSSTRRSRRHDGGKRVTWPRGPR